MINFLQSDPGISWPVTESRINYNAVTILNPIRPRSTPNLHCNAAKGSPKKRDEAAANYWHVVRNNMPAARKWVVDMEDNGELKGRLSEVLKVAYRMTTPDVGD